ncbi:hypothetical protein V5N11_025604 [Cardamine amara subsp. amara]|uniref:Uncharacterized protein n=1 Tax=Cardamine amara subsp. amara TaxID=228776 RepID=A0ABD1C9W1_CARAN
MDTSKFPSSLKKLELECFPEEEHPNWLNPENFNNLEKLSIKGGNLEKLSIKGGNLGKLSIKGGITDKLPTAENKWPVQILRLKYLHEFKVEWRDLKALFPKMILLEKYECPKIAFCPTDGNGVWRSQPQESPNM